MFHIQLQCESVVMLVGTMQKSQNLPYYHVYHILTSLFTKLSKYVDTENNSYHIIVYSYAVP